MTTAPVTTMLNIVARPRIHIGLVDLGHASARSFGGVGFSVDVHPTEWRLAQAPHLSLAGISHLDQDAQSDLVYVAQKLLKRCGPEAFAAELIGVAEQHVGFGTKTSLILALIAGVSKLRGRSLQPNEMQTLSNRGGASGVGTHLFFTGGVVWDGGHKILADNAHRPSSAGSPVELPPLMARWEFPSDWSITLIRPEGVRVSGGSERQFFARNAPTLRIEALETMALMYHGIVPAIVTHDLELLARSLCELHSVGFKKCEVLEQSTLLQVLLKRLGQGPTVAKGMSSMGPLVYCITDREDTDARTFVADVCANSGARLLGVFNGWNAGYEVSLQ